MCPKWGCAKSTRALAAPRKAHDCDGDGLSTLLLATQAGNHDLASVLLGAGADLEAPDPVKELSYSETAKAGEYEGELCE
jgi:hypothetical protein